MEIAGDNSIRGASRYQVRLARPGDAAALLSFGDRMLGETDFFARGAGERAGSVAEMRRVIETFAAVPNACILNAWTPGSGAGSKSGPSVAEPVGELMLVGGRGSRSLHAASLGLGVLRDHWRRGVGSMLLRAGEEFARSAGLIRIELTVMVHNHAARALYRRHGFAEEGVKRGSLRLGDTMIDEVLMAKLLAPETPEG